MTRDTHAPESSNAFSDIQDVCDAFQRALASGEFSFDGCSTVDFEDWLCQVEPKQRHLLAHHLTHLQQAHTSRTTETHDAVSTNVDLGFALHSPPPALLDPSLNERDAAHRAVFDCATLSKLPEEAKVSLAGCIQRRTFEPGERLLSHGGVAQGLFLVISGRVEIVGFSNKTARRIDYDGPGSILGEMSLLTGQRCSADVVALTPVVALVVQCEAFQELRVQHAEIEIALSQLVSDRLGMREFDALCGKTIEGYRLIRCINRGGMGVVYEASRLADGHPCALKMLRHRFISDNRALSRFDFEVELLSRLRHPRLVRTCGHFVAYRTRFLVMDLCDGLDLKRALINHGPMSESTVRALLGQIASGLQYAHQHGAMHLDLKPANILLNRKGNVAIADFGLGRLIRSDGCEETVAGTPAYMAPEQFHVQEVSPAADWYAFGCLAYELLTGQLLFPERDLAQMYTRKHFLPEDLWDAQGLSDQLRTILRSSLEPMVEYRHLDLGLVATWARPVSELVPFVG